MLQFTRGALSTAKSLGIGVCAKKVTKTERKAFVKDKLATEIPWMQRGLLKIFALQTDDEQAYNTTSVNNNVGFTGVDAEILSSFAKGLTKYKRLSVKQMAILKKKMPKYWRQIIDLSDMEKLDNMIQMAR